MAGTHWRVALETGRPPGLGRGSGPVAQVGDVEGDPVVGGAGLRDHLGAGVQAVDRGVRPAVGEERGQVAGAAAEVDDGAGSGGAIRATSSTNGRPRSSA